MAKVAYKDGGKRKEATMRACVKPTSKKELVGMDLFIGWCDDADILAGKVKALEADGLKLQTLSSRGLKVWPEGNTGSMNLTDQLCCRILSEQPVNHTALAGFLGRAAAVGLDFTKVENLFTFDGKPGFSAGQGE